MAKLFWIDKKYSLKRQIGKYIVMLRITVLVAYIIVTEKKSHPLVSLFFHIINFFKIPTEVYVLEL